MTAALVLALSLAAPQNVAVVRRRADSLLEQGRYSEASAAFDQASALYQKLGDPNAAKVLSDQARRYETVIKLYREVPAAKPSYFLAKHEPATGCYLGACIDREDAIETWFRGDDGRPHKDPQYFNVIFAKKHASFFTYVSYGKPFPAKWVEMLRKRGAAAHISLEPRDLYQVENDAYLKTFAQAAGASGARIFLRYACEMNGSWVRYGGNPEMYKQKWRLVHGVMQQYAPNVAMVWCPNEIPEYQIEKYYPGREFVDWVGLNFYMVTYADADRARAERWRNPADKLRWIYAKYSASHPIMIGEWAATVRSKFDSEDQPDFAIEKIGQLYAALPRLYPRIKAVHWLSMNALRYASGPRQLNNYSLLTNRQVEAKYRAMIESPYYLDNAKSGEDVSSPIKFAPLASGKSRPIRASAWVKTHVARPVVSWTVNGKTISTLREPGDYAVELDPPPGKAVVELTVRDSAGALLGKGSATLPP